MYFLKAKNIRLVSPHLSIYSPQFNSILSIYNRVTGIFLFLYFFLEVFFNIYSNLFPYYSIYVIEQIWSYPFINNTVFFLFLFSFFYHFLMSLSHIDFLNNMFYQPIDEFNLTYLKKMFNIKLILSLILSLIVFFIY